MTVLTAASRVTGRLLAVTMATFGEKSQGLLTRLLRLGASALEQAEGDASLGNI